MLIHYRSAVGSTILDVTRSLVEHYDFSQNITAYYGFCEVIIFTFFSVLLVNFSFDLLKKI